MFTNRISRFEFPVEERASTLVARQPAMAAVGYSAVALPWPQFQAQAQAFQHIYQLAYERAKKATEVPMFIRRLYSVWN
jgi:hypothetical protein